MSILPVPQLTDEEYEVLDIESVRCTGCTPCCMGHVHFLYKDSVLWACQTKLERREHATTEADINVNTPSTNEGEA